MRKQNGYVFMETIVVVAVLSVTLILLFGSYAFILRRSRERNTYDTTEMIYKTYYVKQVIDSYKPSGSAKTGIESFIETHPSYCNKMGAFNSFVCDLNKKGVEPNGLTQVKEAFEVDKIYFVNPSEVLNSASKESWLNAFDATTIDYIRDLGQGSASNLLIVKYKKVYKDGTTETIHSSMEVRS